MKFKDEFLRNYIQYKCEKYDVYDFEENDLKNIKNISLNNKSFSGKIININLTELSKFSNLEILSLQNFEIDKRLTNVLNECKKLKSLQLEICQFAPSVLFEVGQLENLVIKYCKIDNLKNIILPENITLNTKKVIDLNDLTNIDNIVTLKINNANIYNFKKILEFKSLKYLNIDGSVVDYEEALNIIKSKVEISKRKEALDIG